MANNELTVIDAGGTTRTLRDEDIGGGVHAQAVMVWEGPEVPANITGATVRHSITTTATALDSPNAGARYARIRVYEHSGTTPSAVLRLYYRTDGTAPLANGTNAFGFLLHGEMMLVRLATFSNYKLIAEGAGVWEVYVEWLSNA